MQNPMSKEHALMEKIERLEAELTAAQERIKQVVMERDTWHRSSIEYRQKEKVAQQRIKGLESVLNEIHDFEIDFLSQDMANKVEQALGGDE